MRNIIGMTVEHALETLKEMGYTNTEICLEMTHDNTVKGLTIGCPFVVHFVATVEHDVVTQVELDTFSQLIA